MKKLILKIGKLSIIPLVVLFLMGLSQEQDRVVNLKRQLFEQYKGSTECLIIGTSHALMGLNPTLFPFKALNIAEEGKPIEVDIEIIEKNINRMPHLKYVIIPIDYFTFYFTGLREEAAPRYYHHWGLKNGFIKSYYFKRYHAFTCGFMIHEHDTYDQYDTIMGYRAQYEDLSKLSMSFRLNKYRAKHNDWNKYWIDTTSTDRIYKRIDNFISMLQKRNIQTILVTLPVCTAFYTYYDPKVNSKNNQLINNILHSTNARYINLQNNPLLTADSLYRDIDHLNFKGATIATTLISNFITKPVASNIIKDSLN
jgi:hypothetical protein